MGIQNIEALINDGPGLAPGKPSVFKDGKRDKSLNTPEFNKKAKARRAKAKRDAKNRKKNR